MGYNSEFTVENKHTKNWHGTKIKSWHNHRFSKSDYIRMDHFSKIELNTAVICWNRKGDALERVNYR